MLVEPWWKCYTKLFYSIGQLKTSSFKSVKPFFVVILPINSLNHI